MRFSHAEVWLNQAVLELPRRCKVRGRPRFGCKEADSAICPGSCTCFPSYRRVWATAISTATVSPVGATGSAPSHGGKQPVARPRPPAPPRAEGVPWVWVGDERTRALCRLVARRRRCLSQRSRSAAKPKLGCFVAPSRAHVGDPHGEGQGPSMSVIWELRWFDPRCAHLNPESHAETRLAPWVRRAWGAADAHLARSPVRSSAVTLQPDRL